MTKNDEFYTQWADIEREMNAYLEYDPDAFRDKVVLLPCDDPEWSNFAKYFALHFDEFGIKKLISTSYLGISWGLVLTGGMNRERCSWPGMVRGVEARIDPAEGAPCRCLTLPCSSTLVRAWMSLRSRRSRTRVRCC